MILKLFLFMLIFIIVQRMTLSFIPFYLKANHSRITIDCEIGGIIFTVKKKSLEILVESNSSTRNEYIVIIRTN